MFLCFFWKNVFFRFYVFYTFLVNLDASCLKMLHFFLSFLYIFVFASGRIQHVLFDMLIKFVFFVKEVRIPPGNWICDVFEGEKL